MFPKIVYHKSYDRLAEEEFREAKTKKVKSEKDLIELGSDWGDHPSLLKSEQAEEKQKKGKKQ